MITRENNFSCSPKNRLLVKIKSWQRDTGQNSQNTWTIRINKVQSLEINNISPRLFQWFKLTLQDIALGWFETESPNWQTEDQVKQAFLKRFNPWGDTRQQQQDAWNKLKFDMAKDDVNAFVVDMKMLASIFRT